MSLTMEFGLEVPCISLTGLKHLTMSVVRE